MMGKLKSIVIAIAVVSTSTIAGQVDEGKKIAAKCHIELFGGGETIHFMIINEHRMKSLPRQLTNRNVMTQLSDKKRKIFKVTECVLLNDDFKGSVAKWVDANTPR